MNITLLLGRSFVPRNGFFRSLLMLPTIFGPVLGQGRHSLVAVNATYVNYSAIGEVVRGLVNNFNKIPFFQFKKPVASRCRSFDTITWVPSAISDFKYDFVTFIDSPRLNLIDLCNTRE